MILAPLLALVLALDAAQPQLQPIPQADCSASHARWSAVDEQGYFDRLPVPPNTATAIWSCRTGGRLLVVKALIQMRDHGPCERAYGQVSAWVDGVKLVDHESTGDLNECDASPEKPAVRLSWLSLAPSGDLTVCRDEVTGEGLGRRDCRLTPVRGRRDPAYRPPEFHTPPSVVLLGGDKAFCGPLTARLLPDDAEGRDRSLEEGAAPDAEEGMLANSGYQASNYRVVLLDGQPYLYVRSRPSTDQRFDDEALYGALGRTITTRTLVALAPDGSVRVVCAWGPRPRPEEFL